MRLLLTAITLVVACTEESDRAREIARVRAHLERVERELVTPSGLTDAQLANRGRALEVLHRYIEAEDYPTNRTDLARTPIFIDDDGARCAMAALIEASGHEALVARIARDHNLAYIDELRDDPELGQWLAEHGLTLREAARIQPGYDNRTGSRWQPTGGVFAGLEASSDTVAEGDLIVAPSVRVGARRITESTGACDHCVHTSLALVGDYSRLVSSGKDTNELSLLLEWELGGGRDYHWYLICGPLVVLVDDGVYGGQAGGGFSFRGRSYPLFFEVVLSALQGSTVRGGVNIGVGL